MSCRTKLIVYISIITIVSITAVLITTLIKDSNMNILKNKNDTNQTKENLITVKTTNGTKWSIEIPAINLIADIKEDTTEEVMNRYIGHFSNTEIWYGNIGLAAHNRRLSSKLFWKT